ncbi:MAG: hypothetical protein ACK55I_11610, partial [bacterium]
MMQSIAIIRVGHGWSKRSTYETNALVDDPNVKRSCITVPNFSGETYNSTTTKKELVIPPRPPTE